MSSAVIQALFQLRWDVDVPLPRGTSLFAEVAPLGELGVPLGASTGSSHGVRLHPMTAPTFVLALNSPRRSRLVVALPPRAPAQRPANTPVRPRSRREPARRPSAAGAP